MLLRTGLAVLMTPTAAACERGRSICAQACRPVLMWRFAGARELQYGNWDGSSAAYGSCPVGEDGRECRQKALRCSLLCVEPTSARRV